MKRSASALGAHVDHKGERGAVSSADLDREAPLLISDKEVKGGDPFSVGHDPTAL